MAKGICPCWDKLGILQALTVQAHTLKSDVHVAFLDMAKAFDSISHESLERALARNGVPTPLSFINRGNQGATTTLVCEGKVEVKRGVKQGDPLSPTLFNLVLDEVVSGNNALPVGVTVGTETVNTLTFADDLVLVASTEQGLQQLVDQTLTVSGYAGIMVNPEKCRVLSLKVGQTVKEVVLGYTTAIYARGRQFGNIGSDDNYKYLGILVVADGKPRSYGNILGEGLINLDRAPLKPKQRLDVLVNHMVPKLLHRTQVRKMEVTIKKADKRWLRLPMDTPDAMQHTNVKDGGLAIPNLMDSCHVRQTKSHGELVKLERSSYQKRGIRAQKYTGQVPFL